MPPVDIGQSVQVVGGQPIREILVSVYMRVHLISGLISLNTSMVVMT